jgi:hypothetical protein
MFAYGVPVTNVTNIDGWNKGERTRTGDEWFSCPFVSPGFVMLPLPHEVMNVAISSSTFVMVKPSRWVLGRKWLVFGATSQSPTYVPKVQMELSVFLSIEQPTVNTACLCKYSLSCSYEEWFDLIACRTHIHPVSKQPPFVTRAQKINDSVKVPQLYCVKCNKRASRWLVVMWIRETGDFLAPTLDVFDHRIPCCLTCEKSLCRKIILYVSKNRGNRQVSPLHETPWSQPNAKPINTCVD